LVLAGLGSRHLAPGANVNADECRPSAASNPRRQPAQIDRAVNARRNAHAARFPPALARIPELAQD
jgi:hypothetical protein